MTSEALAGEFKPLFVLAVGTGANSPLPVIKAISYTMEEAAAEDAAAPAPKVEAEAESESEPISLLDSGRDAVKTGLVWLFDLADQTQSFCADIAESFQDLLSEAKLEQQNIAKSRTDDTPATDDSSAPDNIPIGD